MPREVVVEVKDLVKRYGKMEALRGVTFKVYKGEIFGLLGPNGAGKSTLMSIIAGIRKPTSGEVRVFGDNPLKPEVKSRVSYCPEEPLIYTHLTGLEHLMFYAGLYDIPSKEARRRAKILLERVGLANVGKKYVSKYSHGMRKRLAIAASLINDPDLLLLDEPTVGLDPRIRREIWNLILELKRKGKTVILATHYMEEAEALCDRVAIMDRGRILALDAPKNLKERYAPEATLHLKISTGLEIAYEIIVKEKLPEIVKVYKGRDEIRILTSKPYKIIPEIIPKITSAGVRVSETVIREATLEAVFIALTGRGLVE